MADPLYGSAETGWRAPPMSPPVTNYPPPLDSGVLDGGALDGGVLRAPLAVAVEPLSRRERLWVERVACLGGNIEETVQFLFEHRYGREPRDPERRARGDERYANPREYATAEESDDINTLDDLRRMVGNEYEAYNNRVRGEFDGMTSLVQAHFKPNRDAGQEEMLEHYFKLRPLYCSVGIDDPKDVVFDHLVMAQFLGRNVVVHEQVATQLQDLEATLNAIKPQLAAEMRKEVTSAGGFAPRIVANTTTTSNHALGLALDINANNNPHIVNKTVIALIKDVTKTDARPEGFDFGQTLLETDQPPPQSQEERDRRVDEITQIHTAAQQASLDLQAWLQKALDEEKNGKLNLSNLEAMVNEWRLRIVNAVDLAEAEGYRAGYEEAQRELSQAFNEFASDGTQQRLEAFRKLVGPEVVQLWADEGIRNLPLDLVIALSVDLNFTWGDEWESSKDGMHFDYLKGLDGGVIIPKRAFRGLNTVLERGPGGL